MAKSSPLDQVRDNSPLNPPKAIAEGMSAAPGAVCAWVTIPTRSTDELNTDYIKRLTVEGASSLARIIPKDSPFQFKIQWGEWSGRDYVAEELERLGLNVTDGQRRYIGLGGRRIDDNRFPHRQVLLGIPVQGGQGSELTAALRKPRRALGGEAEEVSQAEVDLRRAARAAWEFHDRMAASNFAARPATVEEIAWALRRDIRRTVTWIPSGSLANGAQVYRLLNGGHVEPKEDHLEVATDDGTSYLRILQPSRNGFPSSELELPGDEWLRELTLTDGSDHEATPVEVSIRGRNLSSKKALKILGDALKLTKEQVREAAEGVAQEPPEDLTEARATLTQRMKEVRKGLVHMVADNISFIVEAPPLPALDRRTSALIDHYGDSGITLWTPQHVQHVLYRETVLGDHSRFTDCEQIRPWTTLVGAWFHGGSTVGQYRGPFLASCIGSTPGPYRDRLTDAQLEDKPVTSAFVGRSRAGKSTAVMLALLGEVIFGAWGFLVDRKGDLQGIVEAARSFDVHVTELNTSRAASGSMDPFRYVDDPLVAASMAGDNLAVMLRPNALDVAEPLIRSAANIVGARVNPANRSTHHVIEVLRRAHVTTPDGVRVPDIPAQEVGETLAELAVDPLAVPYAGPYDPQGQSLPTGPGLVYLRIDDVRMPGRDTPQINWKPGHRLSVTLVQAGLAYATYTASKIKGRPKIVALTELHLLTGYDFGREFIGGLARMGAGLDVNLLLDTQAAAELVSIEGLVDQISAVYAFGVDSEAEARAQAELLGLDPEPTVTGRQKTWAPGQCEARDRWRSLAPIQWDYLTEDLREALNTTPRRDTAAEPESDAEPDSELGVDAELETV